MHSITGILIFAGWIWTVIAGAGVGIFCAILCFLFPPLAQFIFCIYEPKMRTPTLVLIIGLALAAWQGMHTVSDHSTPESLPTTTKT